VRKKRPRRASIAQALSSSICMQDIYIPRSPEKTFRRNSQERCIHLLRGLVRQYMKRTNFESHIFSTTFVFESRDGPFQWTSNSPAISQGATTFTVTGWEFLPLGVILDMTEDTCMIQCCNGCDGKEA